MEAEEQARQAAEGTDAKDARSRLAEQQKENAELKSQMKQV